MPRAARARSASKGDRATSANAAASVAVEEPPAKRSKPDEPTHADDEPSAFMLRLLKRDVHAVHSVVCALTLKELTSLSSTCRTWLDWIEHPPAHLKDGADADATKFQLTLNGAEQATKDSQSTILRNNINQINIKDVNDWDDTMTDNRARFAWKKILSLLPKFSRFSALVVKRPLSSAILERASLRSLFAALADRLKELELNMADGHLIAITSVVLASMGVLKRLETLTLASESELTAKEIKAAQKLDFTPIAESPCLKSFSLCCEDGDGYPCTVEQARVLARSATLTSIEIGAWVPSKGATKKQIEEGILAALVKTHLAAMKERHLSAPRLLTLHLERTVVDQSIFDLLLHLPALSELCAESWSDDVSREQLARLPEFTQLNDMMVRPPNDNEDYSSLILVRFMPHLLQCSQLSRLALWNVAVSSAQLLDLCMKLPKLVDLHFQNARFESLQPLEAASDRLTILKIVSCKLGANVTRPLVNLPAMRALTDMVLMSDESEDGCVRTTRREAAHLLLAVLARMPKLHPHNFEHDYFEDERKKQEENEGDDDDQDDEE